MTGPGERARPIVLVHGSYHRPEHFDAFASALRREGHEVVAPDIGGRHLSGQVEHLQRVVDGLGRAPLVVAHSFGGAAAGALENVAHLLFLSAWVLDTGETATGFLTAGPGADDPAGRAFAAALRPAARDGFLEIDPARAGDLFYHRCDQGTARTAVGLLRPDVAANFTAAPDRAAWRRTPSTYLRPDADRTWPAALSAAFAARAGTVVKLDGADHSPWLSRPDAVTRLVLDLAADPAAPTTGRIR